MLNGLIIYEFMANLIQTSLKYTNRFRKFMKTFPRNKTIYLYKVMRNNKIKLKEN